MKAKFSSLSFLPLLALGGFSASWVQAQNLQTLIDAARGFDPSYQSARSLYSANLAKADQAVAGVLPTLNLGASYSSNRFQVDTPSVDRSYRTLSTTLSASQALYRPGNWAIYKQGEAGVWAAKAQLEAAEQDLVLRVAQAYFDVLSSQDSLEFVRAQKKAVGEQLAAAKRNFEVGTATITDTREAQARFDLSVAQEIAADNDLRIKKMALDQLVGQSNVMPKPLAQSSQLPSEPKDLERWVNQAQEQHPAVIQARINLDVAQLETEKAKAGHKPTVDLVASYTPSTNYDGSTVLTSTANTTLTTVGVNFNLPLYAGGATQNLLKQNLALEEKARTDWKAAQISAAQATRTAFWGVVSGGGQVKALEAAESSSQSALDANKLGYQVGVRINIDVLNSQSQLYQTKRDLAQARYNLVLGHLKLRQASGVLSAEDVKQINDLLAP